MGKIEKLTNEQLEQLSAYRQQGIDIGLCTDPINRDAAEDYARRLMKWMRREYKSTIFMDGPISAYVAALMIQSDADQVVDQVRAQVRDQVGDQVRDQVRDQVGDQYESFSLYGNVSDYGWISFYDFFTQIGVINNEKFNSFKQIFLSGIYDMIQLNGFCIVSNMPDKIYRDSQNRLHSENSSAIHFRDGYEQFYWHDVPIQSDWISHKDKISKQDILTEKNAERRRCIKEIIGNERFIKLLDVEVIDEDKDNYDLPVKLYRSKEKDDLMKDYWYFYFGVCPSTKREYYICVQPCDNVWKAKQQTFNNQSLKYRHGDVGIEEIGKMFKQPIMES